MTDSSLRVALVGCGQIADAHLQEIRKIESASLVGVCDSHLDLARQAAARFGVPQAFGNIDEMIAAVRPDVVHLTTPPQTHLPLGLKLLSAGVHVYIEKPFTVLVSEADELVAAAASRDRKICVGHDQLFDPAWSACRDLVRRGNLGEVAHVESIQGYNLAGPFGEILSSDPDHWVHRLPGGLFQNVMSHAMYRITDFLTDLQPRIQALWFSHDRKYPFPTELRATLKGQKTTANLVFTSSSRPVQRVARIYGTLGGIEVDLDSQIIRRMAATHLPGAFAKLEAPAQQLMEAARAMGRSIVRFAKSDIHYFAGMNRLFRDFYDSILRHSPPPIAPAEIRRVTDLMDQIFNQCRKNSAP
jgi:predicted dehydrogenase